MGSYRQHIGFASVLGVAYAWAAFLLAGIHWLYGTVAALLVTLGGLLPDLDSDSGVELKGFTGILGVLAAVAVWQETSEHAPGLPFELHLWAVVLAFLLVRHGLRRILFRVTVHRGISHSVPAGLVWGAATYLSYPNDLVVVRVLMALAVILGFASHLVLDEVCSVDLRGARVNKAFGTALKLWSKSAWATLGIYALLAFFCWRIIADLPEGLTLGGAEWPGTPFGMPESWGTGFDR